MKTPIWLKYVSGILIPLLCAFLIILQIRYGFIVEIFAKRVWIFVMLAGISSTSIFVGTTAKSKLKPFIFNYIALIVVMLVFGGAVYLNDVIDSNVATGNWFYGLDTLSEGATSFSVITKSIMGMIPAVILISSIIMMFIADTPDEIQSAVIEGGIALGFLGVYGLVQKYMPF